MADTGNGATISFGSPYAMTLRVTTIGEWATTLDRIEDNDLSTTGFDEFIPGDLTHHEEIEVGIVDDVDEMPTLGQTATITYTAPTAPGQSTPTILAGSGFVTGWTAASMENNVRREGSLRFTFDGKTGPTVTPST